MVFSSVIFLLYFLPVFLLLYFFIDNRYKNALIVFASIIFYAWGAPKFVFVVLGTTFVDFHLVKQMDTSLSNLNRRILLILSVSINLGLLFFFKYSGFFIDNINEFLKPFGVEQIVWVKLLLPIGISFYTFETITYVVDVYRKVHKPLGNFKEYLLYILLFPKLIAGPIIRYHELADQLQDRSDHETMDNRLDGFFRFAIGLGKKVLIANQMAIVADQVFNTDYYHIGITTAWIGSLAYTFQIYFDFSGYSDMAIGLGKMIGFRFPENFNNPYTSKSITEFWRRWHISLGNWMKNYLYIPLGGNRLGSLRLYINLALVFVASGFWHGASWNFIFWGLYHGFFLIAERLFLGKLLIKAGNLPAMLFTFIVVNFGWVFFRVEKFRDALRYIKHMLIPSGNWRVEADAEFITWILIAAFFSFFVAHTRGLKFQNRIFFTKHGNITQTVLTLAAIAIFILSLGSITTGSFNPFIYFRF